MEYNTFDDLPEDFFAKMDQDLPNFGYMQGFEHQRENHPVQDSHQYQQSSPSDQNFLSSLCESNSNRTKSPEPLGGDSTQSERKDGCYSPTYDLSDEYMPLPMSKRSHKISKNDDYDCQFKKRKPKITEEHVLSGEIPAKYIPEGFTEATMDEKEKKRILQMIRNRVAAQHSRDKKKYHVQHLEEQNKSMAYEIMQLKKHIKQLEGFSSALQKENHELKIALMNSYYYRSAQHQQHMMNETVQSNYAVPESISTDSARKVLSDSSLSTSPVLRRGYNSGGFVKYSIALVTIFAVMMFSGLNTNNQAAITQRAFNNKGRFLQQDNSLKDTFMLDYRYKDWTEDPSYLFENGHVYGNLIPKAFNYLKDQWVTITDLYGIGASSSQEKVRAINMSKINGNHAHCPLQSHYLDLESKA